jgi:hypothetical protein
MDGEHSFLAWEMVYPLGALLLLVVLGVVWWRYRNRDRSLDPVTEKATRELWDHPEQAKHLDAVGEIGPKARSSGREANAAEPLGEKTGVSSSEQVERTGKASLHSAGPDGPDPTEVADATTGRPQDRRGLR